MIQGPPTINTVVSKQTEEQSGSRKKLKRKSLAYFDSDACEEEEMETDTDSDTDVDSYEEMDNESEEDERWETQKSLFPPVAGDNIIVNWCCAFLEGKDGQVSNIQMYCLKLKVGEAQYFKIQLPIVLICRCFFLET